MLLFSDPAAKGHAALRGAFEAAAKRFYGRALAVAVDPRHESVVNYFGARPPPRRRFCVHPLYRGLLGPSRTCTALARAFERGSAG